jgi:glycosyltransferase involved in cell wall biosynthesis
MRIAFFSTILRQSWGGSEELWSRAAHTLLERGHEVTFCTGRCDPIAAPLQHLIKAGAVPHFRRQLRVGRRLRNALERMQVMRLLFVKWLGTIRPDLVVLSLSCHIDDPIIAKTCHRLRIPYVLLLQAAGPNKWIDARSVPDFRAAYQNAQQTFFVSAENREIIEANLGIDLSQTEIIDNPFTVRPDAAPSWPTSDPFWKLAMVGRINFASKSQDLVLRVFRRAKWRNRPVKVIFWGYDDGSLSQLKQLIAVYSLHDKISYGGFANDIEALWSEHHALLLPSRVEGNALALIEAMLCGRVPIVTNVGRAGELIDDDSNGFIAPAATVELIDHALERAWQHRHNWREMGRRAAFAIRQRHSLKPGEDFAERILALIAHNKQTQQRAA